MQTQVTCKCGAVYMPGLHTHNCKGDTMTATPKWRISTRNSRIDIIDEAYNPVCKMTLRSDDRDLAELIVREHNTHERAKVALKGLLHHGQGEGKLVALYVPQDMLDQARSTLTDMEG